MLNESPEGEGALARFPDSTDFGSLTGPARSRVSSTIGQRVELLRDVRETVEEVRDAIGELFDRHLRCAESCRQPSPRTGFLAPDRQEFDVSRVRTSLERVMDLGKRVGAERDDMSDFVVNLRAVTGQFQLNAQAALIEMHIMNVAQTVPTGSLHGMFRLMNQMQQSARETTLQLDAISAGLTVERRTKGIPQ